MTINEYHNERLVALDNRTMSRVKAMRVKKRFRELKADYQYNKKLSREKAEGKIIIDNPKGREKYNQVLVQEEIDEALHDKAKSCYFHAKDELKEGNMIDVQSANLGKIGF